ncbi:MAG: threonyl-tRNA synthetase [Candidatus Methanomarinus sp.]|nr:MAG: threonyl-tRNA synthetase [ANME-2 cluster archaeon]KAF5424986.1 threonyl-tRNA synthetase [ANME-2 cluster archaeon]
MQILLIHSDYIAYEVKKETPVAEKIDEQMRSGRLDEALTVFIAVEKSDESDPKRAVASTLDEIKKVASQLKAQNIMLYPYAHLSSSLSSPKVAIAVLKDLEIALKDEFTVERAPFGFYKAFEIKCKGHPLSELSRTITIDETITPKAAAKEEIVSEAIKAEEKAKSYWYVLTPDGQMQTFEDFDFTGYDNLRKFKDYEVSKSREVDRIPPHVELMRRLEIADYEPGSDSGNMRFYPKGRMIKSLLETYVLERSASIGAMEVETPIMYDMNHATLKKYLDRFPARQYSIESDKKSLFLRFAACFGQFLMNHDMTISYRDLPLKMIELTRYSFRKEQRGEVVGLRRLRAFTMPDMHTLASDMEQAMMEFRQQYDMCISVLKDMGIGLEDYEVAIRFTRDFYEANKAFITELARIVDKPVIIEMWDQRFFYFVLKFEFNYIDALDKASALSTVQIDVENAERYDINYINEQGNAKHPLILHCSPSGAIERIIYGLLEKNHMITRSGGVPMLPVWLSPTQVRVIPIAERHRGTADEVAHMLGCRVDIDDRDETVGKRIRDAGREWIPYVAVLGDEELAKGELTVTIRSESEPKKPKQVKMKAWDLSARIQTETAGLPYKSIPLPVYLSTRPKFV